MSIQLDRISQVVRQGFWLKKRAILEQCSLQLPAHKTTAIIGPNGAGKTTLFQLLTGVRRPATGEVRLFGKPIEHSKAEIGFSPEKPYFYDFLSARDLLYTLGMYSGIPIKSLKLRVQEVLQLVKLDGSADLEIRGFSKGMLQRLSIAQSILHQPKVLILDEPMSGLDPVGREEVRSLMKDLRISGVTLIFSTHLLMDLEWLCDYLVVLQKGVVLYSGSYEDLKNQKRENLESWLTGVYK